MREADHKLSYLLCALLLVSLMGCAHRGTATTASLSPEASLPAAHRSPDSGQAGRNKSNTSSYSLNQTQSNPGSVEGESSKTDFDIFSVEGEAQEGDLDVFSDAGTEEGAVGVADPLEGWNRAMFLFNDRLYFWLLKPVARGYKALMPTAARRGVRNFFRNITAPVRMVSALLQGKGRAASAELTSFLINSTVGVLGFGDPAKRWPELSPSKEDLGQTLGTYGIGEGFYIVWPILGPSTLRDSVGMVGDWFLDPTSYVEPYEAYLAVWTIENVNETSFRIGDYESMKEAAIDPYVAIRNAYIQNRKKKVEE
jgi:phospholipid-binding lipoprotein MlaA